MRNGLGSGWIWLGVAMLAAPAAAAANGAGAEQRERERVVGAGEERTVDLDEMRASFFERLGEILVGGWLEVRGTIEPADDGSGEGATATSSTSDEVRGTIEPPPGSG